MEKTKVFYINLERSPERRRLLEEELQREGVDATRFNAIDARSLTVGDIAKYKKMGLLSQMWTLPKHRHIGRLGVHLSHYFVWKQFYDSGAEYLLILEDDIVLANNFTQLFDEAVRVAPSDWEVLFLSSAHYIKGTPVSQHYIAPTPGHWRFTNHGLFTYLIKREAVRKLISITMPISTKLMHLDHIIREHYGRNIKAYYLVNRITKHRDELVSDREGAKN